MKQLLKNIGESIILLFLISTGFLLISGVFFCLAYIGFSIEDYLLQFFRSLD